MVQDRHDITGITILRDQFEGDLLAAAADEQGCAAAAPPWAD